MKRIACCLFALTGILTAAQSARADWGSVHYGGYQPWWNIFAKRNPYMSIEEERLQRFWHDYYDSLRRYYGMLDRIDWVAYYKNHGYQINTGGAGGCGPCGGSSRIQFAPVFVSPQMNWAVPNTMLSGTPAGPGCPPPQAFPNHGGGGYQSFYPSQAQTSYYPSQAQAQTSYYPSQAQTSYYPSQSQTSYYPSYPNSNTSYYPTQTQTSYYPSYPSTNYYPSYPSTNTSYYPSHTQTSYYPSHTQTSYYPSFPETNTSYYPSYSQTSYNPSATGYNFRY